MTRSLQTLVGLPQRTTGQSTVLSRTKSGNQSVWSTSLWMSGWEPLDCCALRWTGPSRISLEGFDVLNLFSTCLSLLKWNCLLKFCHCFPVTGLCLSISIWQYCITAYISLGMFMIHSADKCFMTVYAYDTVIYHCICPQSVWQCCIIV